MEAARALARVSPLPEAVRLLRSVLDCYREAYGKSDANTVGAMLALVDALSTRRSSENPYESYPAIFKPGEAVVLALEALEARQLSLGPLASGTVEALLWYRQAANFWSWHFFRAAALAFTLRRRLEVGRPEREVLLEIMMMTGLLIFLFVGFSFVAIFVPVWRSLHPFDGPTCPPGFVAADVVYNPYANSVECCRNASLPATCVFVF